MKIIMTPSREARQGSLGRTDFQAEGGTNGRKEVSLGLSSTGIGQGVLALM